MLGYHPEVILAGRRINDNMGKFIAEQTIKQMIRSGSPIKDAKINVLGLTFKEDVPDLRNSHVVDVINELKTFGVQVFVHDPVPDPEDPAAGPELRLVVLTRVAPVLQQPPEFHSAGRAAPGGAQHLHVAGVRAELGRQALGGDLHQRDARARPR